jgi:hypothetical protein
MLSYCVLVLVRASYFCVYSFPRVAKPKCRFLSVLHYYMCIVTIFVFRLDILLTLLRMVLGLG